MSCSECDNGVRVCFNTERNHLEIEKCDTCCKFKTDLEAWEYVKPIREIEK